MTILCGKYLQEKPFGAFYSSNRSRCKDCVKVAVSANRQANLEKIRAYDRLRGSMPHRVAARAAYAETDAYAASHAKASAKWIGHHPGRKKAQTAVGNAVRDGRLLPWPACALPDCNDKPHGHHPDYDRPLDVVWLCPLHHKQAHALVESVTPEN